MEKENVMNFNCSARNKNEWKFNDTNAFAFL